jgi:predicted RNA-binding Zn ribbon-like protein
MATQAAEPPELATVTEFLNTLDLETGEDELANVDDLRTWLVHRGLLHPEETVSPDGFYRALGVREAIRGLLWSSSKGELDAGSLETLNDEGRGPFVIRFGGAGGAELAVNSSGIDRAVGQIIASVFRSIAQGTWTRLKVCRKRSCRWAFYDRSKNRSRAWCSMSVCGNRVKARAFRRRHGSG